MKIKILDWDTVTSGDISFERFEKYGELEVFGLTSPEQTAERIGDADIVLCNKTLITDEVIKSCKNLKYIGLFATGYNNIDLDSADKAGIAVSNSPAYSTDAVAQHTFALILSFFNSVDKYNNSVKNGDWIKSKTFSYFDYPISELSGKNLSVIGYGSIGKKVAKIADAFGMNVLISTRTKPENCKYRLVSKEEAFKLADVLTIHCPLTSKTENLVNKDTLSLMKKSAYIINTSRGGTINENDLAYALNNDIIAGAGVDVISAEPMKKDNPLYGAKNCIITPHIAWAAFETRQRLLDIVENNLKAFIEKKPVNIVNNYLM